MELSGIPVFRGGAGGRPESKECGRKVEEVTSFRLEVGRK